MEDEYPSDYVCPITMDLMLEPVKASDGYIYEKAAIIDWYKKNKTIIISDEFGNITKIMSKVAARVYPIPLNEYFF